MNQSTSSIILAADDLHVGQLVMIHSTIEAARSFVTQMGSVCQVEAVISPGSGWPLRITAINMPYIAMLMSSTSKDGKTERVVIDLRRNQFMKCTDQFAQCVLGDQFSKLNRSELNDG